MVTKKTTTTATTTSKETKGKTRVSAKSKSPKDLATERGEPWVGILSVDLDPDNIGNGAFELDWNDQFVSKLVRAGYQGKDDSQIVEQWFQTICRNVVMETYEQYEANDTDRLSVNRKNLGNGRTEVS
jgi:hypothetical protein